MIAELALRPVPASNFKSATRTAPDERDTLPDAGWFALILDQIDYGVMAVDGDGDGRLLHVNCAARQVLRGAHPLQVDRERICARRAEDQAKLRRALEAASGRGLRALLMLGDDDARVPVAVVPIAAAGGLSAVGATRGMVLLMIGRQAGGEELSVQCFARSHGLTLAEVQVLRLLCGGAQPNEIASLQCVAVSTIRTQLVSIRAKTGARNIGALMRQVAALPPLVSALRPVARDAFKLN